MLYIDADISLISRGGQYIYIDKPLIPNVGQYLDIDRSSISTKVSKYRPSIWVGRNIGQHRPVLEGVGPDGDPAEGGRDGGVVGEVLVGHHVELLVTSHPERGTVMECTSQWTLGLWTVDLTALDSRQWTQRWEITLGRDSGHDSIQYLRKGALTPTTVPSLMLANRSMINLA